MRRVLPCVILLFARPASPAQQHDDRSPTFPKFESSAHVSDKCMACARILDCLKEGLLPRLRHLQEVKRRSYSKSKYQRLGAVGGLEEIIEEEVERLCVWPRIFHDQDVRTACEKLTTDITTNNERGRPAARLGLRTLCTLRSRASELVLRGRLRRRRRSARCTPGIDNHATG